MVNKEINFEKQERRCNKCKQILPFSMFHKDPSQKSGVNSICKSCRSEHSKVYYMKKKFKPATEEQQERSKEYHKEYYQKNKEKIKQYQKQYRKRIKEECEVEWA